MITSLRFGQTNLSYKNIVLKNSKTHNLSKCKSSSCKGVLQWLQVVYLIYWASPFIIMDMAIKGEVNLILLPELLQIVSPPWLIKCPFKGVEDSRRVPQHSVSYENKPRLLLPIHWCETILQKLVLFRAFSPIQFCVCNAKMKHSPIRCIPAQQRTIITISSKFTETLQWEKTVSFWTVSSRTIVGK